MYKSFWNIGEKNNNIKDFLIACNFLVTSKIVKYFKALADNHFSSENNVFMTFCKLVTAIKFILFMERYLTLDIAQKTFFLVQLCATLISIFLTDDNKKYIVH